MWASSAVLTMSLPRRRRRRLRDLFDNPWFPPAFERRTRPFPVSLNRFEAALLVFILGINASLSSISLRIGRRFRTHAMHAQSNHRFVPAEGEGRGL